MAGLSGKKEAAITPYCLQVPYISCIFCYRNRAAPYLLNILSPDVDTGAKIFNVIIIIAIWKNTLLNFRKLDFLQKH
jgi:hypothetical protein